MPWNVTRTMGLFLKVLFVDILNRLVRLSNVVNDVTSFQRDCCSSMLLVGINETSIDSFVCFSSHEFHRHF